MSRQSAKFILVVTARENHLASNACAWLVIEDAFRCPGVCLQLLEELLVHAENTTEGVNTLQLAFLVVEGAVVTFFAAA